MSVTDDDKCQQASLVWPPALCVGGPVTNKRTYFTFIHPDKVINSYVMLVVSAREIIPKERNVKGFQIK